MENCYVFYCPHCEKNLYKSRFSVYRIGNPIRICEYCGKEYNHPYTYEWSILSILHKFFYCFLANGRYILLLVTLSELFLENYLFSLSGLLSGLVYRYCV